MPLNRPLPGLLPLTGLRVLVVDDDAAARGFLVLVLKKYGAIVYPASGASAALELLDLTRVHVLVSDIDMPEHDGCLMLQRLRARPAERGGRVPAIALTGTFTNEGRDRAIASGFQQFLSKPIAAYELVGQVAAAAGRELAMRAS